jgi:dTDP-4-dehydrorhamnose reductase
MLNSKKSALLIGSSGRLGSYVSRGLLEQCVVERTSRDREARATVRFDARSGLGDLDVSRWDVVVYAAGLSSISKCEKNVDLSKRVNFLSVMEVARAVSVSGGQFIFLSSSAAIEFQGMSTSEAHRAWEVGMTGASAYGLHKFLAEQALLSMESSSVLRLAKVAFPRWDLLQHWVARLAKGQQVEAFDDFFVSPISSEVIPSLISALVRQKPVGLVEASAIDCCSYFEVAKTFAQSLDADQELVMPVSAFLKLEPRHLATRVVLDSRRAEALIGNRMLPTMQVLARYLNDNPDN